MERQNVITLRRMAAAVERDIRNLEKRHNFSSRIAADQKRLILSAIRTREAEAWRAIGHTVSAGRAEAAAAAAKSMADINDVLLKGKYSPAELRAMRESLAAQAERNVDTALARELHSKVPLSTRVYKTRELASGQIDRFVTEAIGRGLNARQIAKEAARFISPNTPGGVAYAAQRLGRTELNNAFHATQIASGRANPFVTGFKWNLSNSHKRPDQCNDFADHDVYSKEDVPGKPHPQCFCYLTPEVEDTATFNRNFLSGRYDSYLDQLL